MRTAGIDLASQNALTAACVIEWREHARGAVVALEIGVDDARILEIAEGVDKIGFDVPLGWPRGFAAAVARHSKTGRWDPDYDHARDAGAFRLRETDRYVARTTRTATSPGIIPLSVSTDRIGVPAMRAAALVSSMAERPRLDGSGKVIEVYPAGALLRWGFPYRQYKGTAAPNRARREELVGAFFSALRPAVDLGAAVREQCCGSDDAFDALVAACVARAAALGDLKAIPRKLRAAARREGWIAVPRRGALSRLLGSPGAPGEGTDGIARDQVERGHGAGEVT